MRKHGYKYWTSRSCYHNGNWSHNITDAYTVLACSAEEANSKIAKILREGHKVDACGIVIETSPEMVTSVEYLGIAKFARTVESYHVPGASVLSKNRIALSRAVGLQGGDGCHQETKGQE